MELSDDRHPQYEVIWKLEDKPSDFVDAEEWIAKKGVGAKGKKVVDRGEVKKVRFVEPLVKPEDDLPAEEAVEDVAEEAVELPEEDVVVQEELIADVPAEEAPAAPAPAKHEKQSKIKAGTEIRIPETADEEPIELIFEEPTLF